MKAIKGQEPPHPTHPRRRKKLVSVINEALQNGDSEDHMYWFSAVARLAHHQRQKQLQQYAASSPPGAGIRLRLGWDRSSNRSVAVKSFSTTSPAAFDKVYFHLLKYEVISMDRTGGHPNIVRLVDNVVSSPSKVCLVMEASAVSGDDLSEIIRASKIADEGG